MPAIEFIRKCIGDGIFPAAFYREDEICEIRLRVNRPAQLRLLDGSCAEGVCVTRQRLEDIVARLNMGSYYAIEDQLRQGYFTARGGIRVGVCGKMNREAGGEYTLSGIGSVCIRIPREIRNCAMPIWEKTGFENILIISPPGMGKTTMIRDYIRLASDSGRNIAVADERREIAACMEGVPQMDVGKCTDVIDDCPKERAIPLLLRSCAPEMIAADEIALESEAAALREASKCGVKIAATAHASGFRDVLERKALGSLIREGIFSEIYLLGGRPGNIAGNYQYRNGE